MRIEEKMKKKNKKIFYKKKEIKLKIKILYWNYIEINKKEKKRL
jgi:hypothetical protein